MHGRCLAATPGLVHQAVCALTPEQIAAPIAAPGADGKTKWSPCQIVAHLADCEIVFGFRLRQTLAMVNPAIQPFNQDAWAERYAGYDLPSALETFRATRGWNMKLVGGLSEADFQREMTHPERGTMTFLGVLETMAGHDLNHLGQLQGDRGKGPGVGAQASVFEGGVDVADQVAEIAATVEEGNESFLDGGSGGFVVRGLGGVPARPERFELALGGEQLDVEGLRGGFEIAPEVGVRVVAELFGGLHLHQLHVQLKDLLEQLGGDELLLLGAGGAGGFGGGFRLLLELDALEREQVLGTGDGVAQSAVGVVEEGGVGEGGFLLGGGARGETIGVELAGASVEGGFEGGGVESEMAGEGEDGEEIGRSFGHRQAEKLLPQPQDLVLFGLMKLKP